MKRLLRACLGLAVVAGLAASADCAEDPRTARYHLQLCQEEVPGTINPTASFPTLTSPANNPNGASAEQDQEADKPQPENGQGATKRSDRDNQHDSAASSTQSSGSDSDYEP